MRRRQRRDWRWRARVYSDPFQHAALAAAVVAPLAVKTDRRVLATAITAALVIDIDHAVAARSVRVSRTTSLAARPRTHSLLCAALVGAAVGAAAPLQGWAAFAGLGSHLLHDAGDHAAPTPLLWPWRRPGQLGRRVQVAGTVLLTTASAVMAAHVAARARSLAAAGGGGDRAGPSPRTTPARS
jgi:membrane-bound metal-dependent hydrolase YbcI (DUF457 family)